VTSVYDLLREACGLSQQEAADYHDVRLDSIKSWCSDRRQVPVAVVAQLQELMRAIELSAEKFAAEINPNYDQNAFIIGVPIEDEDAEACGFPSIAAHHRAIAIAMSRLPDGAAFKLVDRTRLQLYPTPKMKTGASQMRQNTQPIHRDLPNPMPGGFQSVVNSRQRTQAEVDRALFRAENGAEFKGAMQKTPAGPQVSYTISADIGNSTSVMSDIRLFGNEPDALLWLDQVAALYGFAKYPIEQRQ